MIEYVFGVTSGTPPCALDPHFKLENIYVVANHIIFFKIKIQRENIRRCNSCNEKQLIKL